MNDGVQLREERVGDQAAIRRVLATAFGSEAEAGLVDALRGTDAWIGALSLVAVETVPRLAPPANALHRVGTADGFIPAPEPDPIIGHVLFTRLQVVSPAGRVDGLALAPLAVVPERQRSGLGGALVREGLARARERGFRFVIVLGHPAYYPRFGFAPAKHFGIQPPFVASDEAFQALELRAGALDGVSGVVEYAPPFAAL